MPDPISRVRGAYVSLQNLVFPPANPPVAVGIPTPIPQTNNGSLKTPQVNKNVLGELPSAKLTIRSQLQRFG